MQRTSAGGGGRHSRRRPSYGREYKPAALTAYLIEGVGIYRRLFITCWLRSRQQRVYNRKKRGFPVPYCNSMAQGPGQSPAHCSSLRRTPHSAADCGTPSQTALCRRLLHFARTAAHYRKLLHSAAWPKPDPSQVPGFPLCNISEAPHGL